MSLHFNSMASKLLIATVFVFDITAFVLAIAAEQRRNHGTVQSDMDDNYQYCVYDSDTATTYGVVAFLLLLTSQVFITIATRCLFCGTPLKPVDSRPCAVLLFIICWLTFITAEACLLAGSVRNAYHYKYTKMFFDSAPSCETVRRGVFGAGAAFVFFTAIISVFYYIAYDRASATSVSPCDVNIGMVAYRR